MPAQPRQQHLELGIGAVLGLVDDHKRIVQGSPAHETDRRNLDQAFIHHVLELVGAEPVRQGIVEGPEVRRQLVFHGAGQEADLFTRFHGRTGKNDAANAARLECFDGLGDGKIGLACSCRTHGRDERLGIKRPEQRGLVFRTGLDRLLVLLIARNRGFLFGPLFSVIRMPSAFYGIEFGAVPFGAIVEEYAGVEFGGCFEALCGVAFTHGSLPIEDTKKPPSGVRGGLRTGVRKSETRSPLRRPVVGWQLSASRLSGGA